MFVDIWDAIRRRRFDLLFGMLATVLLIVSIPLAGKYILSKELETQLKPVVCDIAEIKKTVVMVESHVYKIDKVHVDDIIERAVAAYGKILSIPDLKDNPNNRIYIKKALMIKQGREILTHIDHDRTEVFLDYLFPEI